MVVVSAEPPTLDLNYFPGNAVTLTATFPADYLDTRTLRSFLGGRESPGVELDVDVTGDVATITLSAPQSLVFDASAAWELDIYSAPNYITFLTGTWIPGTSGEDAALNIDLTFDLPDSTTFTIDGNVGLPGPAGADGPDGLPGLNWLGAWDSGTAYAINDGVSLDGTSYIATAAGTNHTPPNVSYWDVLAEAGTDGLGVPPGGTTGQRLAKASNADNDTVWEDPAGGDVATVNGQTGNVVLDADDIDDSATTNKWTDAADIAKLAGIEPGAEVNDTAAEILTKLLTVDGSGSGLDADLLDGQSSAAFATAAQGALADSATQPGDDAADLGSGAATDGYVLTADGAGGVAWETPAGGGGGGLLGSTSYDPATAASYDGTSSTWADMDATNLTVTFTAPASGKVVVTLEAYVGSANNASVDWCLRDTGGNVANTEHKMLRYPPATAMSFRVSLDILITGLTPGASTTYKWGHSRQDTGTVSSTTMGQWAGPGLMLVREA